jgi:hypothetical protein
MDSLRPAALPVLVTTGREGEVEGAYVMTGPGFESGEVLSDVWDFGEAGEAGEVGAVECVLELKVEKREPEESEAEEAGDMKVWGTARVAFSTAVFGSAVELDSAAE